MRKVLWLICFLSFVLNPIFSTTTMAQKKATSEEAALKAKIARFAPTVITADASKLSANDRKALNKIIAAARIFDSLFIRQVWSGNEALMKKLEADKSPLGQLRLRYFRINKGPWSQLDENKSFLSDVPETKPPQAAHYPDNMTKEEFEKWVETLSPEAKEKATGFFYVIRRDANKNLIAVPYSEAYREFLVPAANLLREAAALTDNATLKDFLNKRATAFLTDDYYDSDVAWMDLDSPIDVTIGPYETYSDEFFSYKAAFEAYVTLRDDGETNKLKKFSQYLQELENNLPIDQQFSFWKMSLALDVRATSVKPRA